jgi:hypothetical protein
MLKSVEGAGHMLDVLLSFKMELNFLSAATPVTDKKYHMVFGPAKHPTLM